MEVTRETEKFLIQTAVSWGRSKRIGLYALASAVNALAAAGAAGCKVKVQILAPTDTHKSRISAMEKAVAKICVEQGIERLETRSEKNPVISRSMVIVTATGEVPKIAADRRTDVLTGSPAESAMHAGQEIVLTKWVGMEGMLRIAEEKKEELESRFAPAFLKQVQSFEQELFALDEIDVAKASGVSAVRQVTEGGIMAALWNLAKEAGTGLEADMKKLSIRQETVEICEHFRLNPYQLTSVGTMLMVTDDGEVLVDALHRNGIQATVIGRLTDNNDKILHNGEEIRYIDRPAPDECLKLYEGEQS